ncbi:MAG: LexA family protein [Huintestinicola sp.]
MDECNLKEIAWRIKSRREELKMTLAEVGNLAKVAASTVQRYEAASISRPKIPVLIAISDALKVNPDWILGKSEEKELKAAPGYRRLPDNMFDADLSDTVGIPVIGRVAAGYACHAEENIEWYEPVSKEVINSSDRYVYLRVTGDSMSPLIMEGDLVLVRCQDMVDNGTYAVVLIDNEDGVVKKVFFSKGKIELRSENPYYPPRVFEGEELSRIRIFGKVIECKRKF